MRNKRLLAVAATVVLLWAVQGLAADKINMKPGKWEITHSIQMPSMPAGMPAGMQMPSTTITQCITGDEPIPKGPDAQQQGPDCEIQDMQIKDDTVTWKMVCDDENGKITSYGRIVYKGTTFEGEFKTKIPSEGMEVTNKMTGRWIGPCD